MSKRRKSQIFYALIAISLGVNLMLLVNVFAVKMSNKNLEKYHNYVMQKEIMEKTPLPVEKIKEEASRDENMLQTTSGIAKMYEEKADAESNSSLKNAFYSVALMEYAKLPKNVPQYAGLVREASERMRSKMKNDTSLAIKLGDSRQELQNKYGLPQIQKVDEKYLPTGIVNNDCYTDQGVNFSVSNNRIFGIKLCSNFKGSWHGIRIGDNFSKISMLYPGRKITVAGSSFGYQVDDLKTTFIFVDKDDVLDDMKIEDRQFFGNWQLALK